MLDPVKANQDFEREWYEKCVTKEYWKPVRAELHRMWASFGDDIYRLRRSFMWLSAACAAEAVAILVLFKLLIT